MWKLKKSSLKHDKITNNKQKICTPNQINYLQISVTQNILTTLKKALMYKANIK